MISWREEDSERRRSLLASGELHRMVLDQTQRTRAEIKLPHRGCWPQPVLLHVQSQFPTFHAFKLAQSSTNSW